MAPPQIRKTFSGFAPGLQIDLKRPCTIFIESADDKAYDYIDQRMMMQALMPILKLIIGGFSSEFSINNLLILLDT